MGLKIKVRERREHCVYFYLYKSKYSTINIQFSYLNFKNFHPHPRQETNKQKVGKYNSLLTLVIMILSIPGSGTMGTGMGRVQ